MPEDVIKVLAATGDDTAAPPVAVDKIAGVNFQKIKAGWGVDGVFQETADTDGVRLPIGGAQIGAINEAVPETDDDPSGLNGRLARIAINITSLIARLPTTLGQKLAVNSLPVIVASDQSAIPVSGSVTANAGSNLNTSSLLTEAAHAARNGTTTDTPPASDTAPASLNGRLQRVCQRLTSAIAILTGIQLSLDSYTGFRRETVVALTVATGNTASNTVDTAGYGNLGLIVPAEFDGSVIQFFVSHNGSTFYGLYDITNTQVQMTVGLARAYDLPGELMVWRYWRLNLPTAQTTTDTVFQLVMRS